MKRHAAMQAPYQSARSPGSQSQPAKCGRHPARAAVIALAEVRRGGGGSLDSVGRDAGSGEVRVASRRGPVACLLSARASEQGRWHDRARLVAVASAGRCQRNQWLLSGRRSTAVEPLESYSSRATLGRFGDLGLHRCGQEVRVAALCLKQLPRRFRTIRPWRMQRERWS
jgi:hypothetical protein